MSSYEERPDIGKEIVKVTGGYTAAEKFIVKKGGNLDEWEFIKQANIHEHPEERKIITNEVRMYEIIHQIPQISKYFPKLISHQDNGDIARLDLQYLADVTWGGPFDEHNVRLLAQGLHDIHAVPLSPLITDAIKKPAQELLEYVFSTSEYAFDDEQKAEHFQKLYSKDKNGISNSRGYSYFDSVTIAEDILQTSRKFKRFDGDSFLVADLNFGNIAFSEDQVWLVDPVYVNVGNAASDNATVGLNILRSIAINGEDHDELSALTCKLFLSDKEAFAYTLAYCMACTTLPYRGEKDPWMDLHQELSEVGLAAWQEMYT